MESVAGRSEEDAAVDDGRVGVYVHLPYCERICPYCDFAVVAARRLPRALEDRYVANVATELAARRSDFAGRALASLYFGGGTPSLFRPESIAAVVAAVRAAFPPPDGPGRPEVTLELNPSTLERDRLPGFLAAGVDRLSIGVQSFDDRALKRLGRAHRAAVALDTLDAARSAGFANISLDLIFAWPGQSLDALDRDLDQMIDLRPEHVSTYELTYEPDTPFGRALASGRLGRFDDDLAAEMIEHVERRLGSAGYARYEISSYALDGRFSRHNARYWRRLAVLGVGMGAHSFDPRTDRAPHGLRRANPRTLDAWERAVEADPGRAGVEEALSPATARGEAMFLGLRERGGICAARFEAEFGAPPRAHFGAEIEIAIARGWIEEGASAPGDLRLSAAGRLVADSVAALFVEAPDAVGATRVVAPSGTAG